MEDTRNVGQAGGVNAKNRASGAPETPKQHWQATCAHAKRDDRRPRDNQKRNVLRAEGQRAAPRENVDERGERREDLGDRGEELEEQYAPHQSSRVGYWGLL